MKKTKKFLSILLATILILSLFPVSLAHASDNTITFSAEADKVDAKAGDIVNVDVCMSENSIVAALTLVVDYDDTALKILDVKSKAAFGYEEFNTAYGENQFVYLTASATPKTVGGTLFTIQFEVLKDGCTEIALSVNELADIDLQTIPSATQSAKIHNFVDGTCASCGEKSVKWKFDEATGTLTIYGTGPMEDYGYNNLPWENYIDDIQKVVIEEGVTTIGNYAFADCIALTSVTLPDSVILIGNYAFVGCYSLTSVTIPDSVKAIGQYAFALCDSLTSITIPDSVTSISSGVFCYCTSLTSVTITESVTLIGYYAFYDCTSLTDVYYSNSEEKLNDISIDSDNDPLLNARIHYNSIGADTHPFNPVITPPTCTEQGYTTYTCDCGYSYVVDYVDATGHSHTPEITISATHLAEGLMTYTCHCGDFYTEIIEKTTEHSHNSVVTPPTCTEQGYTTYTCECGDTYIDDYVNANGHSYNSVVTPPACTETGFTTYTCTACGDTYVDDETPATGHRYNEKITKPATHTENGEMTYTCGCGDSYTETINATGDHYYVPTVTEPTCTEGGYTTYNCACGDTYVGDETSANGHDYNAVVTSPTCTETGYTTYICDACGDTYVDDETSANGHNYIATVTAPTCTETGYTTYTCTVCDDTYVDDETPASGHSFSNGNCTVCGETDPDYYVFSVKAPSRTKIRNKDGIILHTEIEGNKPAGSYVEWTSNNNNFGKTVMNDGASLRVIANNKGNTTFTATLYDANGNELATDSVTLYSDSGFFQKIGGFFRNLFGSTKIYEN